MPIPRFDKTGIVLNLANIQPNFLLNLEKKYFFRKIGNDLKYDPDFDGEAVQKTARADHVLNIEKINDLIMINDLNSILAKIKEEPEEDQTRGTGSAPESAQGPAPGPTFGHAQAPNAAPNTTPRSGSAPTSTNPGPNLDTQSIGSQFRMKTPKFDSQLPIENWIFALDIYMACYNLSEENIIKVSLSQLLTEDSGTSLIESINPEERKNWEAFKSKLIAVLGKDQEHWKHLYNTFQRGSESQAMALTKITAFFKKGYKKNTLDEADEQIVCEKFISAQEPRLKELLTREKSSLNLRNIAQRATELERSFFNRERVFVAQEQKMSNSDMDQFCSKLEKMLANNLTQNKKTSNSQSKKNRIDTTKIQGYCIAFVRTGKCKFGKKCRYVHSDDVPAEVQKLIKKEA